jgi:hypothetical protein
MNDPFVPSSYFTYAEFYEVYRRVAPPDQAAEMARESVSDPTQDPTMGPGATAVLTEDTVILLSLLSPDAEARAEAYWREQLGRPKSPEEQRAWLERRQEFKRWAESGYGLAPE